MAKRIKPSDIATLSQDVVRLCLELPTALVSEGNLRRQVQLIHAVQSRFAALGASVGHLGDSARDRILSYLKLHVGQVIDGTELATVAGISEYARRVRELRGEYGWSIVSGAIKKDEAELDAATGLPKMKPDQYVLLNGEPAPDAAEKWRLANSIRKGPGSVQDKILRYLLANVGKPVDKEQLRYVAKGRSEWARRVRELRTEEGWAVMTKNTGRPDLGVGMYVLEHDRQAEPHDRHIPEKESQAAYECAGYACEACGWNQSKWRKEAPRFLELHHIVHHARGGTNTAENLRCLCNVCHDDLHKRERSA